MERKFNNLRSKRMVKESKKGFVKVFIDEDELLEIILDRLSEYWTKGSYSVEYNLFKKLFNKMVYDGLLDGTELSIKGLVDNSFINDYGVIYPTDSDYDEYFAEYESGDYNRIIEVCDEEYYEDDQPVFLISAR